MSRNSEKAIPLLIDYIIDSEMFLLDKIDKDELCNIIKHSPSNLSRLFEKAVNEVEVKEYRFGVAKTSLSNILFGNTTFYEKGFQGQETEKERTLTTEEIGDNFLDIDNNEDEKPVEFKRIDIKYNYNLGSRDSINLHEALSETSNIDIYKTEAI